MLRLRLSSAGFTRDLPDTSCLRQNTKYYNRVLRRCQEKLFLEFPCFSIGAAKAFEAKLKGLSCPEQFSQNRQAHPQAAGAALWPISTDGVSEVYRHY